ncbi:MAG TPA: DUF805 domain-containing protein [Candidatus Nesterenkonia stercoripullorum]|uniref:DUF805 domain-containing protein n=1 Tax=Candidatus Nesterenkonia stercoripullorum TaxID=2838701 RepID=A0A9D2A9U1_9MICC|nr:DUF805 domain-containing protein [Candidatus Nesterenkonia stercoripullorum]
MTEHVDEGAAGETSGQPLYGATWGQAIVRFFKKYARFKGYASRSESWWAIASIFGTHLAIAVMAAVLIIVFFRDDVVVVNSEGPGGVLLFPGPSGVILGASLVLQMLVFVVAVVPALSLTWRRLHDAGLPGPMVFLWFVPLAGWFVLVVFHVLPSQPEQRRPEWDDPRDAVPRTSRSPDS